MVQEDFEGQEKYHYREAVFQDQVTAAVLAVSNDDNTPSSSNDIKIAASGDHLVFKSHDNAFIHVSTVCPLNLKYNAESQACEPCAPLIKHSFGLQETECLECLDLEATV